MLGKKCLNLIVLLFVSLTVFVQTGVSQQTVTGGSAVTLDRKAAKYILSPEGNAVLIRVKIWGEVRNPGIYDVPSGIDLIELLSSAGGPTQAARLSKVKIIHRTTEEDATAIETIDVQQFIDTGNSNIIPVMQPDDTIIVPAKFSSYLQTTLSWTGTIVNIVAAYALVLERYERAKTYK